MRRILAFGLAWLAAGILASVVAWQGVGLIGDQVTDDHPDTLTAAQVDEALARSSRSSEATTPTTAAPGTTGPSTTAAPSVEPVTRVYTLAGGSAAFRFTPDEVTLAWATPNAGYTARNGPGDNGGWRVEFDGPEGEGRVDAWWDGGPRQEVRDDADDDHDADDDDGPDDDGPDDDRPDTNDDDDGPDDD